MIRKGLFLSALAAAAMTGAGPAQASIRLAATSGIINQLYNNSSLSSNMAFTICDNGSCQTLFTGVAGVRALNNDLTAFNSWAGTGSYAGTGGFFDNYRFTFSGAGSYFGNTAPSTPASTGPSASLFLAAPPIPEPATWAMMILGFGLVGMAMRRRRASLSFG